ncbi:MAG: M4 family metallopeptidase [Planctomycetota bacterium]
MLARNGLGRVPGKLVVTREFASLAGWHLRLRQVVDGVPVHGSEVSVHLDRENRPLLVNADVWPVEGVSTTPATDAAAATAAARDLLEADDLETKTPRLVILPAGRRGTLAWLVDTYRPEETLRLFLGAVDLEPVRVVDLRRSVAGVAHVFDPNPVHTLRDGDLVDDRDADSPALRQARRLVTLHNLDGTGYLRGRWADVSLTANPAISADLDWSGVTRDERAFEQVMAYYHVDRTQDRLRSLGLANANARAQQIDARGVRSDNSWFDPYHHRIRLGTGGVDDGEDADIIRHEYGHAIQEDQVEDWGRTEEGRAMGEGFADFLAADGHATGDRVWDPLVAAWDATSYAKTFRPYLRRVDEDLRYPDDFTGDPHSDGRIWSRFLWDLRRYLGSDDALRVVVESHFLLTPNARFADGANAVLLANRALRDGRDDATIRWLLERRGIVPTVEAAPLPEEDAFEPNDDLAGAAPIAAGVHARLRLEGEDWFRVEVPALRRLRVTVLSDARTGDVGVEIYEMNGGGTDGGRIDGSDSLDGTDLATADAGPNGRTVFVRVYRADGGAGAMGYDLSLVVTTLEVLPAGRTRITVDGTEGGRVFLVPVEAAKSSRLLRVAARRAGRRGVLPELRLLDPDGLERPGDVRKSGARRTRMDVRRPVGGPWVVELRPRGGEPAKVRLRVVLR